MNETQIKVNSVPFSVLQKEMQRHFGRYMNFQQLYIVDITPEEMWKHYLTSFPEGSNPIFRARTEHDCSCCRNFIRDMGNVVTIDDNKLISIWDINHEQQFSIVGKIYEKVANAMSDLIKSKPIKSVFMHHQKKVGVLHNHEQIEDHIQIWDHFYCELSDIHIIDKNKLATKLSDINSLKRVAARSLAEINIDAAETVLDLISQNSLYRGEEHRSAVQTFITHKRYYEILDEEQKILFAWSNIPNSVAIRNTVIGTLLTDLSTDVELDVAVTAFEKKVAPTNYKRPKALITPKMVRAAEETLTELGLLDSLPRRHAEASDLNINALIWADRSVKRELSVFDEMAMTAHVPEKNLSRIEEVPIDKFLTDILPNTESLKVLVENEHLSNLVSFLAPENKDAAPLFSWGNNFSWTYKGETTDSIKERVKRAGGSVTGLMRCSLAWSNYDDLDIHVRPPNGYHIYYGNKRTRCGELDVDMNAGGSQTRSPVENVTWNTRGSLQKGKYKVWVNNYQKREMNDVGFTVELEHDGTIHTFHYANDVPDRGDVTVIEFEFTHADGIKVLKSIPSTAAARSEWGVATKQFIPVSLVMNSPNHWDDKGTGNRHLFFILEGCKNPEPVRGFFNEYLHSKLTKHRKVFETLGAKMKAAYTDNQLSGLGFSSTQRNHLVCQVAGNFNRTIKVLF